MIRGNAMRAIAEIGRLQELLTRLSDIPRRTAIDLEPKLNRLLRAQFTAGTDPYGRPWRPLKPSTIARGRRPPPLSDTRRLKFGTKVSLRAANRAGLVIQLGEPYGYFHQVGFHVGRSWVAPRRILPQFGLPASWRFALEQSARKAGQQILRGAA